jgi:hypothetical protein
MGDRDDCAVLKSIVHSFVDDFFGSDVDISGCLVNQHNL